MSMLAKGAVLTEEEREELRLSRLLPPEGLTLEEQVRRAYEQYLRQPNDRK